MQLAKQPLINLLPEREKKELFLEKTKKLVIILGNIFLVTLTCLILLLFTIQIYINGEVKSEIIILEQTKKTYEKTEAQNLQNEIKKHNRDLLRLNKFYKDQLYPSDVLEKLSEIIPQEIYFTNLSFKKEGNTIKATISGFSKTRERLTFFRKELEGKNIFKNINFSQESWIKPVNADFHLTFEIVLVQ